MVQLRRESKPDSPRPTHFARPRAPARRLIAPPCRTIVASLLAGVKMAADSLRPIARALLSVSDKSGLVPFAQALEGRGIELLSTGGTAKALAEAGLKVAEVEDVTGFPEMLDGRVKTLHPAIHGGLLARRDRPEHEPALARHGIRPIDLLVVNLSPFAATVAPGGPYEECLANIDIGGAAHIRAAAENQHVVTRVHVAAFELEAELAELAVAIVKHAKPCGVAVAAELRSAWDMALACDPVSAYGGIIAVNRPLDAATAEAIAKLFVEVVIAPAILPEAEAALRRKTALRLLVTGGMPDPAAPGVTLRSLAGGYLLQSRDNGEVAAAQLKTVTQRAPTPREVADLLFAFRVAKHVKSNAIVYAKGGGTVGIGAGQMSRVDSARIAAWKAAEAGKAAGLPDTPAPGPGAPPDPCL